MATKYLSATGLSYFFNRLQNIFASKSLFDALNTQVQAINVPTAVSQLENDKGYITNVDLASSLGVSSVSFQVVSSLPATGDSGVFYLKAMAGGKNKNLYEEWVWVNKGTSENPDWDFEMIGNTAVDLSGYLQTSDIDAITTSEIDSVLDATLP